MESYNVANEEDVVEEEQQELPFGTVITELPDDDQLEALDLSTMDVGDGKTVADVMREVAALRDGLKMSEQARLTMETAMRQPHAEPAPSAPVQQTAVVPPWGRLYTDEDFAKIEEDQGARAAAKAMIIQNNWLADQHFERRIASLQLGGQSSAEQLARQQYPDEFELFDKEIKKLVEDMPDKRYMNTVEGWEQAISYIRGQKGNIDKYVEHRQKKNGKPAATVVAEAVDVGFSPAPMRSAPSASAPGMQMDATTRAIAESFVRAGVYKNVAEYAKDYAQMNKGGGR
jgi:hypothetical protein